MITLLLPLWVALHGAWAATQADVDAVAACLALQDVACAQDVVTRAGLDRTDDPTLLAIAAEVAFYASDYPAAYDLLKRAVAGGFADEHDRLGLYERTMYATAGWVEVAQGRFRVRYRPGVDAVLVDDALVALERTDRFVTPLLGPVPPGRTVVELYPDGRSFVAASSLTRDDVEATGVVAISKWTRLLVSSPRALGRGYEWTSTLSHEYIHLVVAAATRDRAPVWLQEGIAKYLDGRWEHGRAEFQLDLQVQGLLAEALAGDGLVPFDEMHPSLAKIKVLRGDGSVDRAASAQRAALAYGQLASLVDFCFREAGDQVLLRTLSAIRGGTDPRAALASAAGRASFDALLRDWEVWIRQQGLVDRDLEALPTVLDGGTDAELDPVLSKRRDLANFLRLGDLLAQRGHARAALVEYEKAHDEEDPTSPLLANRVARALLSLGEPDRAWERLQEAARDYPEYPLTWRTLGQIAEARGDRAEAIRSLEKATALSPFDVEAQQRLLALYREAGEASAAERRARLVRILERGGEDVERPPIHERSGTYELPRDPEVAARRTRGAGGPELQGKKAPDFAVTALDGATVRLAELRGKVVVVDFWATWCGPCKAVMPELSRMAAELGPEGLVVLGVSDEPEATVTRWVAQEEARGRVYGHRLALEDGSGRRAYGVRSIPTLVVIDRGGTVRLVHVGAGDLGHLRQLVIELLGAADAPEPLAP